MADLQASQTEVPLPEGGRHAAAGAREPLCRAGVERGVARLPALCRWIAGRPGWLTPAAIRARLLATGRDSPMAASASSGRSPHNEALPWLAHRCRSAAHLIFRG